MKIKIVNRARRRLTNFLKKNHKIRSFLWQKSFLRKKSGYYIKYLKRYKTIPNLVVFETFMGRNYACSPRALYEEMVRDEKYKDFEFIWAFKKGNIKKHKFLEEDGRTTVVRYGSKLYHKAHAQAKYWITNSLIGEHIIKREDQVYIQTWHGTPLKRLRYDIEGQGSALRNLKEIREMNDLDVKRYDYMLSPSEYASEKFRSAFNLKNLHPDRDIIVQEGYPRNDCLFKYTKSDAYWIKNTLGIPQDKKIILYAPTFRDNQHTIGVGYTYELGIDFDVLKEKFADEYVILFRTHYFVANKFDFEEYEGFIYNVSKYDDINDLYLISDILITDYSSVFFDFANLNRPMLFYMYDLADYKNNLRDFYFDLNILPGPIVEKQEDLIKELENISSYEKRYAKKYKEFNNKFNHLEDGNSSKRVLDTCIKID